MSQHPEDLLSALLDGELRVAEADAVRAHLDACPACAAELDAVRAARTSLRMLPGLSPPSGWLVPRRGRRVDPRWMGGTASLALLAAALLMVALGDRPTGRVVPGMAAAVDRHAAAASLIGHGGAGRLAPFGRAPVTLRARSAADLPGPLRAPAHLGGYSLARVFDGPDGLQLVYERGPFGLSVFEVEGRLDSASLSASASRLDGGGWRWDNPATGGRVVVVQRGDVVVTVVGDESPAAVIAAARAYPVVARHGVLTRLARGCDRAFRALSPF